MGLEASDGSCRCPCGVSPRQDKKAADSSARYLYSKISLGTGLLNKNPCISSQPSNRSSRDCSSVSTPSATTLRFSECARLMIVDISDRPDGPVVMSTTNERSTLTVSTGSLAK